MAQLLLVDDDEDFSGTLQELFEMQDHVVVAVDNGTDALAKLQSGRFDLVLLDWQLPDMSGVDVCKQYRAAGGGDPILMLTGMRDTRARDESRQAGASGIMTKPFTVDELLLRVRAMLDHAPEDD
jgi:DNA-binding response OmpR family regulator